MTTAVQAGLPVHADVWLTDVMGLPVFRVDAAPLADHPAALTHVVSNHAAGQRVAMYYAKVATDRVHLVRALGDAGLAVIDVAVTFRLDRRATTASVPPADVAVGDLVADQVDAVLDIAGSCFRYSRFHLDPQVPDSVAHRVKREWVDSYVRRRRGERLIVATVDGRPAGFLAVIASTEVGSRVYAIDLVGVAGWAQRRGVGRALVQDFVGRYADAADELRVGTQVANVPSIRLYEQLGFSLVSSQFVLHGHRGGGPAGSTPA